MPGNSHSEAWRVTAQGIVQGVGFRPRVYQIARELGLKGQVYNTSGDVTIEIEGRPAQLQAFLAELQKNPPVRARLESLKAVAIPVHGYRDFKITASKIRKNQYQLVSPDLATCPDCLADITNPADRRFRYPFTNCTNCGPRFTIIQDIPYDRKRTTMCGFAMCPACRKEYADPSNRRFHAQPNACPVCGPQLRLTEATGEPVQTGDIIKTAAELLKEHKILALKGLGGFLLACDAGSEEAVARLRRRKQRPCKPLAVMFKDLKSAGRYCHINRTAAALLAAPAAPIVLLKTRPETELAPSVAPGLNELGVMLPYTPLHHLLLKECGLPLVMTSGNLSEEPIAQSDSEALEKLGSIADYFILHNREIASRYDDSVMTVINNRSVVVRRARGLAPNPLELPYKSRSVLAAGPELKNTFCLTRGNYAFVSQHIGDMENPDTVEHFEQTVRLYRQLFRTEPQLLACDLHPDYLSTRWAQQEARRLTLPLIAVQHHHAHIVSCMVENQIKGPVIGVALDGSGYGADGQIWGGEFMTADYNSFTRRAHFQYLPLPGGELAIRRTSRLAAAYIYALLGENPLKAAPALSRTLNSDESEVISTMIERRLNTPLSSSCGRLFDAVSALLNICQESTYEGQAAVELEAAAAGHYSRTVYPYRISEQGELRIIEPAAMLAAILADMRNGLSAGEIAARFHNSLISIIMNIVQQLSAETGLKQVALSGGVFQNRRIFGSAVRELRARGLQPLVHRSLPANDGCIALGQAAAAEFMYQAP